MTQTLHYTETTRYKIQMEKADRNFLSDTLELPLPDKVPENAEWYEIINHGFACNISQCPNGANIALSDDPNNPKRQAYDVRCWRHSPVSGDEIHDARY